MISLLWLCGVWLIISVLLAFDAAIPDGNSKSSDKYIYSFDAALISILVIYWFNKKYLGRLALVFAAALFFLFIYYIYIRIMIYVAA